MKNKKSLSLFLIGAVFIAMTVNILAVAKISNEILLEYNRHRYIVKQRPNDPWAHFNLAITYAYMGKVELGLKSLGKVEELDKKFAPKAISHFKPIVEKEPNNWQARFRLGFAYYFNKQRDLALKELLYITKLKPLEGKNAWAYGYMAVIYGEQEKWDASIEACKKALAIEPDAAAIRLAYSQALLKKGNTLGAANEAFKAFKLQAEEKKYERQNNIIFD